MNLIIKNQIMMTSMQRSKQSETTEIDGAQHSIEFRSVGMYLPG
jgi:hypothetical protein